MTYRQPASESAVRSSRSSIACVDRFVVTPHDEEAAKRYYTSCRSLLRTPAGRLATIGSVPAAAYVRRNRSGSALDILAEQDAMTAPAKPMNLSQFVKQHKIPLILLYYGLCSSTLIVINKVAVHSLRAPTFILIIQLVFAATTVETLKVFRVVEAESLQWTLVKPFLLIVAGFLGTLFANIKVLVYSNVETFITFRSSTPLVLSFFDWLFLGRELPGGRSIFSILMLIVSCAGYTWFDAGFKLQAYTWLTVWYVFFLFEACYVKHICDTVHMSNWGRVKYTNLLSGVALMLVFPICKSEHELIRAYAFSPGEIVLLVMSCAVGVCMSHAGYLMRSNVSATAGVVVGVVCKIGSVLLNLAIWDQHASPIQLCFLALGLAGGSLFQQAPLRKERREAVEKLPLHQQDMTGKEDDGSKDGRSSSSNGFGATHMRSASPKGREGA